MKPVYYLCCIVVAITVAVLAWKWRSGERQTSLHREAVELLPEVETVTPESQQAAIKPEDKPQLVSVVSPDVSAEVVNAFKVSSISRFQRVWFLKGMKFGFDPRRESAPNKLEETSYEASAGDGKEFVVLQWEWDKAVLSGKAATLADDAVQIIGEDGVRYKPTSQMRWPNDQERMCWMSFGKTTASNSKGEFLFILPSNDRPIKIAVGSHVITLASPTLLPGENVFLKSNKKFFSIIAEGNANEASALIKTDPNLVEARGDYNMTALHVAAREGKVSVVEMLLATRALPSPRSVLATPNPNCAIVVSPFPTRSRRSMNSMSAALWTARETSCGSARLRQDEFGARRASIYTTRGCRLLCGWDKSKANLGR